MPEIRSLAFMGYPKHSVDSDGNVYGSRGRMKLQKDNRGYLRVGIQDSGKLMRAKVHRLVAVAFHGQCPSGMECSHLNEDKTDNRASNLLWATRMENMNMPKLKKAISLAIRGERNGFSKLDEASVKEIREAWHGRELNQRQLARKYGVDRNQIHRIIHREYWKHVI